MKTQSLLRITLPIDIDPEIWYKSATSVILIKMCKMVGANYFKMNFFSSDWFHQYEWSIEKQNEFEKWTINFLYRNKKAKQEWCRNIKSNKKEIEKTVKEFIWNYGWKTYSG